jgi:hypothetical protein
MAMTRRNFLQVISGAVSTGLAFLCWLLKKTVPRRFTKAVGCKKYPGPVKALEDIDNVGKWSG